MLVMTLRFSYNRGRMKKENNLTGSEDFSAFYQKKNQCSERQESER